MSEFLVDKINREKAWKKKVNQKMLGPIIGIPFVLIIYFFTNNDVDFDKTLSETAKEINKTCPIVVDEATRLDSIVVFPGKIFQYNYTLTGALVENLDTIELNSFLKPSIINTIKTNPDLKVFRDNNVTMKYYYLDQNGKFVTQFSFSPSQYKKQN